MNSPTMYRYLIKYFIYRILNTEIIAISNIIQYLEMVKRDTPGIAIGGLSGGEEKSLFWNTVTLCTDLLPESKPRYLMGVG